ncbi:MAG: single-stranded DNA-binding protein [Candidatus Helarchaeota archaeon]
MEETLEFSVVSELGPRMKNINVKAKCESINEVREVTSRGDGSTHRVTEAVIGDETGSILLTIWDDTIDRITIGNSYVVKNSYTSLFRGSLRLNLGRYGELEDSDEEIETVNTENNLSDKVYESPRRFQRGPRPGGSYGRDRRDRGPPRYQRRNPRGRSRGSRY